MANAAPFSLRIFVADGDPDRLRLVERSNWIGKAVLFPRGLYPWVRGRAEFNRGGVCLLLGPRFGGRGESTLAWAIADGMRASAGLVPAGRRLAG